MNGEKTAPVPSIPSVVVSVQAPEPAVPAVAVEEDSSIKPSEEKSAQKPPVPDSLQSAKFILKDVLFEGNVSFSTEQLKEVVSPAIGKEIVFEGISALASAVKKFYKDRGYIAVYVYVPPQDVAQGIVTIKIIEGRLGRVEISGNKRVPAELIRKFVPAAPGEVVSYQNFTSYLYRLNTHPSITARAVLKPGETQGTTDVQIVVEERSPLKVSVDANNLGSRNTGKYRYGISAVYDNLFGRFDMLSGRYQAGRGFWAAGGDYQMPVGIEGAKAGLQFSHVDVDVGGDFSILGLEGRSTAFTPYYAVPLIGYEDLTADFKLSADIKSVQNRLLGNSSGKDELRILNLEWRLGEKDSLGQLDWVNSLHFGFSSFLGASHKHDPDSIRPGSDNQFFAYRSTVVRYPNLPHHMALVLRASWQWTPDDLPTSEKMIIGGFSSIRGYAEGEYQADIAGFGSAEWLVPIYIIPDKWHVPGSKRHLKDQLKLVTFVDAGGGKLNNPLLGEKESRGLVGAGAGLRFQADERFSARVEWGFPVGDDPADDRRSTFYFGASCSF